MRLTCLSTAAAFCLLSSVSASVGSEDTEVHDAQNQNAFQHLSDSSQVVITSFATADDGQKPSKFDVLVSAQVDTSLPLVKPVCDAHDTRSKIEITFIPSEDVRDIEPSSSGWADAPCTPEEQKEAEHLAEQLFFIAEKKLQPQGTPTFDFTNECQSSMWIFTFTVKNTPGYYNGECEDPGQCTGIVIPGLVGAGALVVRGPPPFYLYNHMDAEELAEEFV